VLYLRAAGSRGDLESYAQGLRSAGVTKLTARQVPDAGHFIPDEQPAGLWRAIHEFIATPVKE
jgi:pimeloyl-ACP methyl ester carboxylesterase